MLFSLFADVSGTALNHVASFLQLHNHIHLSVPSAHIYFLSWFVFKQLTHLPCIKLLSKPVTFANKRHSKNIASQAKKTELFYKMDEMLFPLILIKIILKYVSL